VDVDGGNAGRVLGGVPSADAFEGSMPRSQDDRCSMIRVPRQGGGHGVLSSHSLSLSSYLRILGTNFGGSRRVAYPELDDRYIFVISRKQGGLQLYFVVDGAFGFAKRLSVSYTRMTDHVGCIDVLDSSPRRAHLLESEKARGTAIVNHGCDRVQMR
jgi:hypothetical protein